MSKTLQPPAADVRAGKGTDLVEQSLQAIKYKAEYKSIIVTLDDAAMPVPPQ